MRYPFLKRRSFYIPVAIVLLLALLSAVVFNPGFQKNQLLKRAGPMVDSLEIGRIHVTPWTTEFDDVTVVYEGGRFHIDEGRLRYGLFSLIFRKIKITLLSMQGVRADLTNFSPPQNTQPPDPQAQPAEPFAGILAALDTGFGYILEEISVNADVRLSADQAVIAALSGGGIRPETTGNLALDLQFLTGTDGDHIDVDGGVRLDQLTRGRFSAIETTLAIRAALASLPQAEHATLRFLVEPAAQPADPAAASRSAQEARYTPEAIELSLRQNDSVGTMRAALDVTGLYDGNDSNLTGDYKLTANERLVQPYAADALLAPASETLSGKLAFDVHHLTGNMTVSSELLVSDLQTTYDTVELPERLQMQNDFRLSLLADRRLRVEKLDTAVGHGGDVRTLIANLTGDQSIPLDDVDAFLRQDNTLLSFELPGLPLMWLNYFLPEYQITSGSLSGAFVLSTDVAGSIYLRPSQPLLVSNLSVNTATATLFEGMNISLSPNLAYTGTALALALEQLDVTIDQTTLVTADLKATMPMAESGRLKATASAQLQLRELASMVGVEPDADNTLPDTLEMSFDADILSQDSGTLIDRLDGKVGTGNGNQLVTLALLQPLSIENTAQGGIVVNQVGNLAIFNVSDIDLGWFSALLPGGKLEGALRRADFKLAVDDSGMIRIAPDQPFRLEGVTVATANTPLLEDIGIRISPMMSIGEDRVNIGYEDLELASKGAVLASGRGTARLSTDTTGAVATEGHISVDLGALAQQPVVAAALGAPLRGPVRLEADYQLAQQGDVIDINELVANLFYGDAEPKLALLANSNIRIRTSLASNAPAADQARGELTLTVKDLTARPFADLLAQYGVTFASASGKATLSSDGSAMHVVTDGPFEVTGIAVNGDNGELLAPFAVALDAEVDVAGDQLTSTLNQYRLTFNTDPSIPTIMGQARLELDGSGESPRLSFLTADVAVQLPALLRQPGLMPGNRLTAGKLNAQLGLAANGQIDATVLIDALTARAALPLQSIRATVGGTLGTDGGFSLTAPVTTTGKSGVGVLEITALRERAATDGAGLSIAANGDVLYLNDILGTLEAIAPKQAATKATKPSDPATTGTQETDAMQPDLQPFWGVANESMQVDVDIKKLFYTDYFGIDGLTAHARVLPQQLALERLRARFHDSPMALDGTLDFVPGPTPYDLKLNATVDQLDLATFFRKLDPDARPRAEGLFDFRIDAFGQAPNMPQFRNELYFDMHAESKDGIFHLLDPNSAIVAGTTGAASTLGAVVSYVPTGLFGLGAVPRLVGYIEDIAYDRVSVQLSRGESRNVEIRQFVLQSEEVLMTASGGVEYREGLDILHSPLALDARLDMRGEGAAIMYDMDLLDDEQNRWNYWKGPNVRFWGTPVVMQSNLSDIISQAGKGMVVGGISRPISGLIGNIRHQWSDPKEPALDYDGTAGDGASSTTTPPQGADNPVVDPPSPEGE